MYVPLYMNNVFHVEHCTYTMTRNLPAVYRNATGRSEVRAAGVSAVLLSTRGWFASEAARLTYDRKNSFARGSHSWSGIWAERSFMATPPSWARAPASASGMRRCRRLADSSVHQRASGPPNRFLKLVLASGACTVTSQPSP